MNSDFLDYYRCPANFVSFALTGRLSEDSGYFRFGPDVLCYGRSASGFRAQRPTEMLYDGLTDVAPDGSTLRLPFSPSETVANLRYERYASSSNGGGKRLGAGSALRKAYYTVRPILSVSIRKHLQRRRLRDWKRIPFPRWPADPNVELIFERLMVLLLKVHRGDSVPFIWFWPNGSSSCAVMTHDVEALPGRDFCPHLMDLDGTYEIKSSFQIVPEGRYTVPESFLDGLRRRGFEINVHDLNHDGHLFSDRELFFRRVDRINRYGRNYGAAGFRSAVLYRNPDWYEALDFAYDMSVPSVGHLDPQRGGCCSVMPFFIGKILELPVTTTQDYSLFHILNQYSIDLWKRQIDLITEKHGLVSFIVHPDYLLESRARDTYEALLAYLAELRSERKIWIALPGEVDRWWRERSQMRLIRRGNGWEIEGPGKERARIAYASLVGDSVVYRLEAPSLVAAP
ncbi:MAG: hypothetical protein DMG49_02610 [Acidobacteria bacterium]|nr:MAG: hypothetical protein DMG49_02610 [Acidobacteriota bacterium]